MDRAAVQRWLDAYIHAWTTYDTAEIRKLFSKDAACYYHPFGEPIRGRDAIVASWLSPDRREMPGTYAAEHEPIAIDGDVIVTHGRSHYYEPNGKTLRTEFDNIFVLRFDEDGRCIEFREWFVEHN